MRAARKVRGGRDDPADERAEEGLLTAVLLVADVRANEQVVVADPDQRHVDLAGCDLRPEALDLRVERPDRLQPRIRSLTRAARRGCRS